jgi:hypothetical protein
LLGSMSGRLVSLQYAVLFWRRSSVFMNGIAVVGAAPVREA